MLALFGIGLVVVALVSTFALAPRNGEPSKRQAWIDICAIMACSFAIVVGSLLAISTVAGW